MENQRTCVTCGEPIDHRHGKATYCSPVCVWISSGRALECGIRCLFCGKQIVGNPGTGRHLRYCSSNCRHHASRIALGRTRTCAACGEPLAITHKGQTCSPMCRYIHGGKHLSVPIRSGLCEVCGTVFIARKPNLAKRFCSTKCKDHASEWGTVGSRYRKRARRFGVTYERIDRLAIFDRDGWTCYLCGRSTPRSLLGVNHPYAPVLEHVIPLSRGGTHTHANVACSCSACNASKGSKTPSEYLRTLASA